MVSSGKITKFRYSCPYGIGEMRGTGSGTTLGMRFVSDTIEKDP